MAFNILVTDASYKHSLGIVRALGKIKIKPFVLGEKKNTLSAFSKYSKGVIVLPQNYDYETFLSALKQYSIELIILVGTNSFKKIVPWKLLLKKNNVEMLTVDLQTQELAFNKVETYKLAEKIGVPIPKTFYPKTIEDIQKFSKEITYPCVIKGLYEVGGNIVDYAYNEKELPIKYNNICKKYDLKKQSELPMLQEYISGFGCAFFAVYNNGVCGPTFQHKRIREYPVTGGASVCAESYINPLLEKYGRLLLDALSWHGIAMVEFKMNSKNEPVLMEINPKFWGSTDLALEAGVNFPKYLIDIYQGKELSYSNVYKYPFKYHWPFDGDIQHGIEKKSNFYSIIKDFFNPKVKSNFWFTDLKPSLYLFAGFCKTYIVKNIFHK